MKKTISRGKCELFNSGETGGNSETPRYCFEVFGEPQTRTILEWRRFILESGKQMDEAQRKGDNGLYQLAQQAVFYGWLAKNCLKYPDSKYQHLWKMLELPTTPLV